MTNKKNILVGITMGDPLGIGPEIIISALSSKKINKLILPVIFGNYSILQRSSILRKSRIKIIKHKSLKDAINNFQNNFLNCLHIGNSRDCRGKLSYDFIEKATKAAMENHIQAIVTAPINKLELNKAGYSFPGHTELLAKLTNCKEVSLMLATPKLNVIHVTAHMGLVDAIEAINPQLVYRTCKRGIDTIIKLGNKNPKIGVCGINPHAGENGLFGYGEEKKKIIPAINRIKKEGFDIHGPLSADALFYKAALKEFDLIVAMYHDQGHCPVKVLGIDNGVNITTGLPVIRTSVDHGTGEDITGKGIASDKSLLKAINLTYKLVKNKKK